MFTGNIPLSPNAFFMKRLYTLCILVCFPLLICAQEGTSATGGEATGAGGQVSYSLGQLFYHTLVGTTGSMEEGVQLPYEILTVGFDRVDGLQLVFQTYPIPATDRLTLSIAGDSMDPSLIMYMLFDVGGRMIATGQAEGPTTQIDMGGLESGTYFLRIIQHNKALQTFKVIKK